MIKVTVEGQCADIVSAVIAKALRDAGIKTNHWRGVTPSEVASCRRDATREGAQVSIVAMSR